MKIFSDPRITIADEADIPSIVALLNISYRGEESRKGWTTEADLISGEIRTNQENLSDVLREPGSVMLTYKNDEGLLQGCVNLKKHGDSMYMGMFSVTPSLQGGGIGKKILAAAEEYAQSVQCSSMYMHVISLRSELISWYKRRGYKETGTVIPFPEDGLTGKHLRHLEFLVLKKSV
jgi:ribosomal protein S18 acetylase RimI-like enzyme